MRTLTTTPATETATHARWCTPGDCRCEAMAEIRRLSALPLGKGREIHGAEPRRDALATVKRLFPEG